MEHIGKRIKQRVEELRMPVTEFASKINKSRTVAYNIFERKTIDTGLLNNICKVLNYNFYSLLNIELLQFIEPTSEIKLANDIEKELRKEYSICQKELDELKEKYELLKKINGLLEEKIKNKKA